MDFKILSFEDNAQGQLDSGISASALTIPLKSGEGAEFPQAYSGNTTSTGDKNTINATGIGAKLTVGDFLYNNTDNSHCWVISKTTDSAETTDLIGGTLNTWENSDEWFVNPFVVTLNTRDGNGQITSSEKALIKNRSTDTLTAETRGYDGSSVSAWSTDDYVDLFVVSKGFQALSDAISEASQLIQDLNDTKADLSTVTTLLNARSWKQPVRLATTSAGTLATSFENGDTLDGETLATGDRILIKNQADASENGIYTVNASGAPTRATDFDLSSEITSAVVAVEEGTSVGDSVWLCSSEDVTIGTDDIVFVLLPGSPEIASQAEAEAQSDNVKMMTSLRVGQSIAKSETSKKIAQFTTAVSVTTTSETTIFSGTVPVQTIGQSNVFRFKIDVSDFAIQNGRVYTLRFKYGSTTVATIQFTSGGVTGLASIIEGELYFDLSSTTNQEAVLYQKYFPDSISSPSSTGNITIHRADGSASENSQIAQTFTVTAQTNFTTDWAFVAEKGYAEIVK